MLLAGLLISVPGLVAQDDHHSALDKGGDHIMGFSHEKTTHHFRLYANGGAIDVTANDAKDTQSRDQIRMHLSHIAGRFAAGNFRAPMLIHDQAPPGVPTLQRLKTEVSYRFEEIPNGGRVRIATENQEALAAVHEFCSFRSPNTALATPWTWRNKP